MHLQLNSVIIDADQANRQELANVLSGHGVNVVAEMGNVDQLPALLGRDEPPQLVVINLDPHAQETLKKIGPLPRQFPAVNFFLMSQVLDASLLMEAMHLGVKEFIPLPMSEQKFTAAIERVNQSFGMGKKARIIQVIPTIGGCGSTTVACNVAASLAKSGKTALLDMDLIRGGVASYFDVRSRYTLADIMEAGDKVDQNLLDNALTVHANSGVAILSRPELPEDTQRITGPEMVRVLGLLGRIFDYVVIDSVMSVDPLYAAVMSATDIYLVVMQLNVPSAKNAERFIGAMRRTGIESDKIKLVVNRYVKKGSDIEPDEVERALGLRIAWMIPNDFKNAIAAINFGEPVVLRAPRSEMSSSLGGLAGALNGASKN